MTTRTFAKHLLGGPGLPCSLVPRCCLLALALLSFTGSAFGKERPNILFIFADDQNYKTISCEPTSPDWISTPNIDALARSGVRFERAYFGAWCMPSRASFLTGHLQHGVQSMRMDGQYPRSVYDPQQCRFFPAVFREKGYHTAQIGKWHTGIDTGNGRDWDHQIVWNRPGHPENAGNYFYDQIVTVNGKDQPAPGYSTDNYTNWALDYIRGANRDETKPWYLWLCYGAVHGPTTPAERHDGKLTGNHAPPPADIVGPFPNKPAYLQKKLSWQRSVDGTISRRKLNVKKSNFNTNTEGQEYDDWVQQTNECMMAIDEGVGRLVDELRNTGQLDNTIVVYTADQGYSLGHHGLNQKVAAYDAAIASQLIISRPGERAKPGVCRHAVNAPDVVRWFCDIASVELPWKTHGRDITPLLQNPASKDWDRPMLMTHTGRKYGDDTSPIPTGDALHVVGGIPWYALLRDGRFKYIRHFVEGETEELYDLDADPEELVNLAVAPDYAEKVRTLRKLAIEQLRKTDASFADQLPPTRAMQGNAE